MKFKKRLLSEEIGLPKSNKKTFTNGKKQKVVVSEEQLQRLISVVKQNKKPLNEMDLLWRYIEFLLNNLRFKEFTHKYCALTIFLYLPKSICKNGSYLTTLFLKGFQTISSLICLSN